MAPARLPMCVEIVGPAGSGKSTLQAALGAMPGVHGATVYRSLSRLPLWWRARGRVSSILRDPDLDASRRERIWITRLEAADEIARREATRTACRLLVFDQGPVFALTKIGGAIETRRQSDELRRWRQGQVRSWSEALAAVVVLDGPDDALIKRVRTRSKAHPLQHLSSGDAEAWVRRERADYEATLAELGDGARPAILRFDTTVGTPIDAVAGTIAALDPAHEIREWAAALRVGRSRDA